MKFENSESNNAQALELLNNIGSQIESGEPILTSSERLNKDGHEISQKIYDGLIEQTGGNYKDILKLCKDSESLLRNGSENDTNLDQIRIIQSVRGKVVYNAHKDWAMENFRRFDTPSSNDASNVMYYTRVIKEMKQNVGEKFDVYETSAKIKNDIEAKLSTETAELQTESNNIYNRDIERAMEGLPDTEKKKVMDRLKDAMSHLSETIMDTFTKRKFIALTNTIATFTIVAQLGTGMVEAGNRGGKSAEINALHHRSENTEQTAAESAFVYTNRNPLQKYLTNQEDEIPIIKAGKQEAWQSQIEINKVVDKVFVEKEDFTNFELPAGYEVDPKLLVNMREQGLETLNPTMKIRNGETLKAFLKFQELANKKLEEEHANQIIIFVTGYRSEQEQQRVHDEYVAEHGNDIGVAKPRESILETGFGANAMLVTKPEKGKEIDLTTLKPLPTRFFEVATEAGLGVPSIEVRGLMVATEGISKGLSNRMKKAHINTIPLTAEDKAYSNLIKQITQEIAQMEMEIE